MRLAVVVHVIGTLVRLFGPMMLAPSAVAAYYGEWTDAVGFVVAATGTILLGQAMRLIGGASAADAAEHLRRIEGMAIFAGAWLLMAHVAGVPYMWAGLSFIDALFEAMSGLTTTGATVIRDFGLFGNGMFFWRSMTQWLGGMGVIALFVAVLPRLTIGGRELFFAEASGLTQEKLTPHLRHTASALWKLYAAITAAQTLALWLAGMSLFDAVCHAMTTLAAGGFSPHQRSLEGYPSATIQWIVTLFMFIAGVNFALQVRMLRGNRRVLVADEEFRAYTGVVIVASALLFAMLSAAGAAPADALRHAVFQVVSIVTTTGYASEDFGLWSAGAQVVLLALMFVGGSAGSAAGGPKVVRHVLMAKYTLRELRRTLHPRAVLPVKLGGRIVPDDTMRAVVVFMLFYILTFAIGAGIVILLGADLVAGISGTAALIGNVGPGFGTVGPMGSFADLHPISRIVLTLEMWIGRLEILTVLVLLHPEVWRTARWDAE
jgi:trk system potassium uptake protein TrkH